MTVLQAVRNSSGLYPMSAYWVVASAVVALAVEGWIGLGSAIAILGIAAALAILTAAWSELKQIHKMMDGQRAETLARLDKLETIITSHGIPLPPESHEVAEARVESGSV